MVTFDGIPYAAPPVGDLRFMPPIEPSQWEGDYFSVTFALTSITPPKSLLGRLDAALGIPRCLQAFETGNETETEGSEDCLYLSVYTPRSVLEKKSKVAVYLYFHGGAYAAGASSLQDGAYIAATQNIGPCSGLQYRFFVHAPADMSLE